MQLHLFSYNICNHCNFRNEKQKRDNMHICTKWPTECLFALAMFTVFQMNGILAMHVNSAFLHVRLSHAHFQSAHSTHFLSSVAFLLTLPLNVLFEPLRFNKKKEILLCEQQYSMQILHLLPTVCQFWWVLFVNWQYLERIDCVNYILNWPSLMAEYYVLRSLANENLREFNELSLSDNCSQI